MRANERVLVQEDVEQIKITLAIVNGIDLDDYNNYVKEYNKHYLSAQKESKIDSIISHMKEKWEALKKRLIKAYNNKRLSERQIKRVIKINMKIVKASFK
jgi:glutamyl-tRNA reductase